MKTRSLPAILAVATLALPALVSANGLDRTQRASRRGTLGLESIYEGDRQKNFLVRRILTPQDRVVVTFSVKPDEGFRIDSGNKHEILHLREQSRKKPIVQVRMFKTSGGFRLQFRALDGKKLKKVSKRLFIPFDTWTRVRLEWIADEGSLRIEKNNTDLTLQTNLDSAQQRVDLIRFGQVSKAPRGWFGEVYFDDFEVRNRP